MCLGLYKKKHTSIYTILTSSRNVIAKYRPKHCNMHRNFYFMKKAVVKSENLVWGGKLNPGGRLADEFIPFSVSTSQIKALF